MPFPLFERALDPGGHSSWHPRKPSHVDPKPLGLTQANSSGSQTMEQAWLMVGIDSHINAENAARSIVVHNQRYILWSNKLII